MGTATKTIANYYQIDQKDGGDHLIGQGGMGSVYQGHDTRSGETVAIKLLKPEIVRHNPEMVTRFQREGQALRQLNHPNIVKMLAFDEIGDTHYLVMEYVSGGTLRALMDKHKQLSIQHVLYIALDLADALTRAHRLRILHRDLKPANVLIADDGTPRLTDFGMARMGDVHVTQDGMIVGTLAYMSPEALSDENIDERADIWSFGVLLYEMLAGERPFPADNPGQLVQGILTHPLPDLEKVRPDLPTGLIDLVQRMLARDRNARIPSVRLVGAELESIIRTGTSTSTVQAVSVEDSDSRRFASASTPIPAPTSQVRPPNNLPAQPTSFVGRESELQALQTLLADPTNRLITLLGPGGIGKTRLSLAYGERQLEAFQDGVFFVALAPLESANFLVATIAEDIGFTFGGTENDRLTELVNYLREKRLLLILDNFEHLISGADVIAAILQAAPEVRVLVTSRERLRLRGEQVFDVDGMLLPPEDANAETLLTYPIVKLFRQSALRVVPDFVIDDDNAAAVARICALVSGLPLGVELAAAWLEVLDPAEIVNEIEQSLDFLETDLRDVPERHRSLRAVYDYSWNLMTDAERETFVKLAVFRGGFERDAAQKVTGASLRTLTNLVNKSLLRRDPNGRYQLHKMLRQYAEDAFADTPEAEAAHEAHARYYAAWLTKLAPMVNTSKEKSAFEAIDRENENLRVAWCWAKENGKWRELAQIIDPLSQYYLSRSLLNEGYETFQELATLLEDKGQTDEPVYWLALARAMWIRSRVGDYDYVWEQAMRCFQKFYEEGDNLEASYALTTMAYVRLKQGRYDEARHHSAEAVRIVDPDVPHERTAYFMGMANRGYAEFLAGHYEEARDIYEALNNTAAYSNYSPSGIAYGKNNLGEILREMGEVERAKDLFQEAHSIFKSYGHRRGMAFTLNNLAGLHFLTGEYQQARKMYEEANRLNQEIGDRYGMGHSYSAMGNICLTLGQINPSRDYFQAALDLRRDLGDPRGVADSLSDLARIAILENDLSLALQRYDQVVAIRREIGDRQGLAYDLVTMAGAMLESGNRERAEAMIEEAYQAAESIGQSLVMGLALAGMGEIYLERGDYETAIGYYRRAFEMTGESSYSDFLMGSTFVAFATLAANAGDYERAMELVGASGYEEEMMGFSFMRKRAVTLTQRIGQQLDAKVARAALKRGEQRDVAALLRELLGL